MVFTIQSQYIDSLGKLRIIYGFHNNGKQLINLFTFPLAPLNKVPIETRNKVQSFSINTEILNFIKDLKGDLNCTEAIFTSTGCWLKNSTFPPSVFVPIVNREMADPADIYEYYLPFPLMIDEPHRSKLDTYKGRVHKANIFKQYVVFLYSYDPANYHPLDSFVIKKGHDYDFENWNPPNWMAIQNKKMIVASNLSFAPLASPILSKLSNQNFRLLNFKRLDTCIKESGGACLSTLLPKPSEENKWMEYKSPAGGHCLFHSVLRGWAKLHKNSSKLLMSGLEFNLNSVDFDVEETVEINRGYLNHWTEIAKLRQLTDKPHGPGLIDALDRSQNVKEILSSHSHFWGTNTDIQILAKKLNVCILVFSKPSLLDFLPKRYQMLSKDTQHILKEKAKENVDSNTGWHIFSPSGKAVHFADYNNCPPDRTIFINNSSGNHYNLLVPHIQVEVEEKKQEEPNIQLIVPNREFAERLDFYLQNQLQLNPELKLSQKNRETIPDFYEFKSDFKKWDTVNIFSSLEGVKQWIRFKKTSAEYLKRLVSPLFRPSETDLARLVYKDDPDFQKDLLVPFFFSHYQINNGSVALVQNVLSTDKNFVGNLFQALLVSRIWVLYQVNRGPLPEHDVGFPPALPDLKWGLSVEDLKRQIKRELPHTIFNDYNVVVYSPSGDLINGVDGPPQAHLIQYGNGDGYAAILFVSLWKHNGVH